MAVWLIAKYRCSSASRPQVMVPVTGAPRAALGGEADAIVRAALGDRSKQLFASVGWPALVQ